MIYTKNHEGIRLDVQAEGFTPKEELQERILKMLTYLTRFTSEKIVYATIHMENNESYSTNQKSAKVILGVPGPDIIASDEGDNFMALIANIEEKLARQLKK